MGRLPFYNCEKIKMRKKFVVIGATRLLFRRDCCHHRTVNLSKQMLNLSAEKNFNLILYMPQTCLGSRVYYSQIYCSVRRSRLAMILH